MLKEFDVVKIGVKKYKNINVGDIGTIIYVFDKPELAYEVEILNENGETIAIGTFLQTELVLLWFNHDGLFTNIPFWVSSF